MDIGSFENGFGGRILKNVRRDGQSFIAMISHVLHACHQGRCVAVLRSESLTKVDNALVVVDQCAGAFCIRFGFECDKPHGLTLR